MLVLVLVLVLVLQLCVVVGVGGIVGVGVVCHAVAIDCSYPGIGVIIVGVLTNYVGV